MSLKEIIPQISGLLTVDFQRKSDVFALAKELGIKPIEVNQALKAMNKEGIVDIVDNNGIFVRMASSSEPEGKEIPELKRAPSENRVRAILEITEEDAEGLDLLTLRTPPMKKDLVYPEGVTKEMYNSFKARILDKDNYSLLWDLVKNFNGARGTAITMWDPEHEKANKEGKVFYRWDEPEKTWKLMEQLCRILDLYEAQETQKEEVVAEE